MLTLTLHKSFHAHYWRVAWVGFDVIELVAFAATGWAIWRGRQIAIACLLVTGTLLCCDAWFDVILDSGTRDVWGSLASAAFVELPLAFLMFNAARRLIRLSALVAVSESADDDDCESPGGSRWVPATTCPRCGRSRCSAFASPPAPATVLPRHSWALLVVTSQAWLPISPRRPRPTPSSSHSAPRPARACGRSWSPSSGTCTRSPGTSS